MRSPFRSAFQCTMRRLAHQAQHQYACNDAQAGATAVCRVARPRHMCPASMHRPDSRAGEHAICNRASSQARAHGACARAKQPREEQVFGPDDAVDGAVGRVADGADRERLGHGRRLALVALRGGRDRAARVVHAQVDSHLCTRHRKGQRSHAHRNVDQGEWNGEVLLWSSQVLCDN